MSKRSILLVTPSFPPAVNGLAHVAHAYARSLQENGHTVEVFTPGENNYEYDGLKVVCLPLRGSFSLRSPIGGALRSYRQYLASHRADIVICHALQTVATDLALAFFPGKKIYHSHGISWRSGISENPLRRLARRVSYLPYEILGPMLLRRTDAGIFLGHSLTSDRTFDRHYFRNKAHAVIPNASFLSPGRPRSFEPKNGVKLLVVGSCTKEKGFAQLTKLIPLLEPTHVRSLTVCTMRSTPFFGEFQDLISQFKTFPINLVLDATGDALDPHYRSADLLINLSLSECYPLVMADAVNARIPTLCFDTGYQREILGAKTFPDISAIARYLNDFPSHHAELRTLSVQTEPRSWPTAGRELTTFLDKFGASYEVA